MKQVHVDMEPLEVEVCYVSGPRTTKQYTDRIQTVRDGDDRFKSRAQGLSLASNLLLGSQAPYDSRKGAHVRTITIEKHANYVLRPVSHLHLVGIQLN